MANRKSNVEAIDKASSYLDSPERFKFGEISTSGINLFSGVPRVELKRELDFPNNLITYQLMSYHPTINAGLNLYSAMTTKAEYRVVPVSNATEEEKRQAKIIHEMLFEDMDIPFENVVQDALTMNIYGFSVLEKVFRYRAPRTGSIYNDNLVGIKKLSIRNQHSIDKFVFSDDGNSIVGVKQVINSDSMHRYAKKGNVVVLPRSKFLLFNTGSSEYNPYGVSPLRNVYLPWKYLSALEELEAQGVQKELHGVPLLKAPGQYMSTEASEAQKAIFENLKSIVRNLQQGSQAGVVLPSEVDPETRKELFSIELLSTDGKKSYDTNQIKEYYRNLIFIGLGSDLLQMGTNNTGSFALASVKNTLTAQVVEGYLKRILQVINNDLIRHLYEMNGWDASRRCKLDYENVSDTDLESYSKAVQRISAVGLLPKTLDVVNRNLDMLGVDRLADGTTEEELTTMLSEKTSRSGDSFDTETGGLNGTSDIVSGDDTSSLNQDNAA